MKLVTKSTVREFSAYQKAKMMASRKSYDLSFTATKSGSGFNVGSRFFKENDLANNELSLGISDDNKLKLIVVEKGNGMFLKGSKKKSATGKKSTRVTSNVFESLCVERGLLSGFKSQKVINDVTVYEFDPEDEIKVRYDLVEDTNEAVEAPMLKVYDLVVTEDTDEDEDENEAKQEEAAQFPGQSDDEPSNDELADAAAQADEIIEQADSSSIDLETDELDAV